MGEIKFKKDLAESKTRPTFVLQQYYMAEDRKSRKGDNKSIRFDEKKYELICAEEKLESPQQVVDFLVDKYWWEKKIGNPPTLERQPEPKAAQSAPEEKPIAVNTVPKKEYFQLLNDARIGQMDMEEFKKANLTMQQKDLLLRKNEENK